METIISACISAGVTLAVCLITQHYQTKSTRTEWAADQEKTRIQWEAEQEKMRSLMEYKLDDLTKKVEKHNSLIERTYKLEEETKVQEEKINSVSHRVDDLEKKGDPVA